MPQPPFSVVYAGLVLDISLILQEVIGESGSLHAYEIVFQNTRWRSFTFNDVKKISHSFIKWEIQHTII